MTNNDIKKGLECCGKENCRGCPYRGNCHQGNPMIRDALDYINHLEAQNENLKAEVETELDKLNAEKNDVMYYKAQIKAEAYKEFVERLKNEIDIRTTLSKEQDKNVLFYIDNLYKELVGKKL